ncbi:MAG: 5'/3'-nucleotidase SurE [Bacteroidetes bacterium]|nr:5'/3'-nucleotidase SurE [Bacteroidota bacterium]MBL7104642.1 5'/3'-nucleotidase SurE [Bacteroidales bacterium]
MKKPLILITNDDGIFAPGLRKLIEIARQLGNVVVVAPETSQSGMSHAITVRAPLRLRKITEEKNFKEYSCNGTPVDAVKMGEQIIVRGKPDLVLSGINHGSNASVNIIYSGTMAAVLEATIDGISAVGFSILNYSKDADFSAVDEYVKAIIVNVLKNGLPEGICLNVNIPAIKKEDIKGIKVCRQAKGRWKEEFDERIDPHNRDYYWLTGVFQNGDSAPDTDSWALANNYISVVPVHYDFTSHKTIPEVKKWKMKV